MDDIPIILTELQLEESVFKDVKYYVSGHVQEKILEIFRLGGAERMNYFSDYVTHLVCGADPDENDLADANDVYEIPIVTPRWVITCAKLHKCITPKGFKYDTNQLFSGLTFTFSHIREDKYNLWALITYNGGSVQHNLNSNTTHLLTFDVKTQKYLKAFSLNDRIKIVTPDFVIESVKAKQLVQHDLFHPKLLTWPKPRESTALITGFEQDDTEKCSDIPETESTQALLDQLKQRMPWNQPNTPKTTTPPSTTYQSFLTPTPAETTTPKPWAPPTPSPAPSTQFNFNAQPEPPTTPKRVQWNNQTSTTFPITPNSSQIETPPVKTYPQPLPELVVEQPQQTIQQQPPPQLQQTTQPLQTTQQQFLQRVQRQQLLNQAANNQFNNNQIQPAQQQQQQQPLTTQIGNRTFIAATQQSHLVTAQNQQPQQYKLQIAQSHLTTQQPTTQQPQQQIGLIRQQQPQQIMHQTSQPMLQPQNRLQSEQQLPFNTTQQVTQQFPLQQQQQPQQTVVNTQFGPRAQLQQEQIPFTNQNQQIQMNQQPQQQIYNQQTAQQFIQQKVQQRPMHPNWQAQQIVQQQQLNQQQLQLNPQLNQQQLQQQQLTQQQLNPGQINQQLQQRQINQQQLSQEQQVSQQINPQLNQQQLQQQLTQQQLNQQQLQQRQLNQQQLNQEQQLNPGQTNQQQINPGQINQQQLQQQLTPQQIGQQLNQQLNQQQLQQQQAQLNQRQIAQQQQINQVQLNQQQLQQPQINQPQQITAQQLQLQQLNQQQQQIQLTPQQLQQRQALAQQQLAGQQINQTHLVQQQQLLQQQQQIQRPIGAPRLNWSPNQPQGTMPQRQLIHLDAQTHQQLQQMNTQQRAIFVAKIQKQRQIMLQQRQHLLQQQQRGGHLAVIRGGTPPGLNPQPQIQWLQQQQQNVAKQQTIVMPQHAAPGLSPIAQGGQIMNDQQSQQIQIQRQQFQRLQQLQMQREQAQKQQLVQQVPTAAIVRPPLTPQEAPSTVVAVQGSVVDPAAPATPQQQLVNAKTKTALANMLSIRLQSGGGNITPVDGEPSAAGTLRLMTAQHNAALNQTAARPQELIAIQQQRRTLGNITNATSDLPRAPPPTPAPTGATPQSETKPQFSPGRVLAPPQHRHGPFYGHNPNLKLPPELFLLGCIFVVVEVERYLEETSPDWRQVIEKHGGEIEPVYCSRVTHVLCETQRHGVVMQALRDFKRCVTLFWLDDVVQRKQVVPPWQALHLPTGYIDGAPASKHLISLSGFTGNDRNKVREMITYTGAKFTKYFSRHNTVLVCAKSEGVKHQHAKKWNTPIVNVQWLTDLMLGNFSALNQIEHVKYQQFTQPTQFGFDTALVPNLMFAWKMPINISQESYERVKRSASPVVGPQKAKKARLEPQSVIEDEKPPKETSPTHRILFSMHDEKDRVSLEKIVIQLGGSIANSHEDATHLVMSRLSRTMKLLFGIAVGTYILPDKWLKDSEESQKFLPENDFKFDTKDFNATYFCDFYASITLQNRDKLFANKVFFLTPSVFPSYSILKELIERCGGLVEKNRRSLQQIEAANATVPYSYVILTTENDLHLVYDCLRNIKGDKRCVSNTEVVLDAILNQKIAPDKYLVKVY